MAGHICFSGPKYQIKADQKAHCLTQARGLVCSMARSLADCPNDTVPSVASVACTPAVVTGFMSEPESKVSVSNFIGHYMRIFNIRVT